MPTEEAARKRLFQTTRHDPDPERYNPYRLRAEALERPLAPEELGRVLFHLGLRRGFTSNRLEGAEEEGGKLKERIDELKDRLGDRTLGQFLWARYQAARSAEGAQSQAAPIRFRGDTEVYPERSMYAAEFDQIRGRQAPHHALSPDDWEALRARILWQWPLKPVERGACSFLPDEPRHWRDTPIGHDFRVLQELNALRWIDSDLAEHRLDAVQREAVLQRLVSQKSEVKFASLRKLKSPRGELLFPDCRRFNLEEGKRSGLKPHRFAATMPGDPALARLWEARKSEEGDGGRLDDIFVVLFEEADPDILVDRLAEEFGLSAREIEALGALRLSRATASVSRAFMEAIVPVLRDQGLVYSDAVAELRDAEGAPQHHSHRPGAGDRDRLPYYGEILSGATLGADPKADPATEPEKRYGRIGNPTVHVALNALRRVVNALIDRFGSAPAEIHVELARELKRTKTEREEDSARRARSERENERIRDALREHGIPEPSALDIKKVKLWEELGQDELTRRCPFTDRPISFSQLINGEAEVEHILPFKRTLDDSMANLTVALRWANRIKGNRTPHEAFGNDFHAAEGITWDGVRERGEALPPNKSWRFGPDAMERFERDRDFIARQLTDNAYIARAAADYLGCLSGVETIVPNRGGLTALLRGKWRLNGILSDDNRKTREDHRHHAVDAAVIALCDRALLQEISRASARGTDDLLRIEVPELPEEIEIAIRERVPQIVVAYKPDHGWQAAMFKDTAYGFVPTDKRDPDLPEHNLVVRKALTQLSPAECATIRDRGLRARVQARLQQAALEGEKHEKGLADIARSAGIGTVRILVKDQTVMPIPSAPYKGYKQDSYVCCDVWRVPAGKRGRWKTGAYKWAGEFWAYADTPTGVPDAALRKPHPAAKLVARLYKDDLVAYEDGGATRIMRVAGFSTTNNKLDLCPHQVTEGKQNYISINVLGAAGLRKLRVEPDGRVRGLKPRGST